MVLLFTCSMAAPYSTSILQYIHCPLPSAHVQTIALPLWLGFRGSTSAVSFLTLSNLLTVYLHCIVNISQNEIKPNKELKDTMELSWAVMLPHCCLSPGLSSLDSPENLPSPKERNARVIFLSWEDKTSTTQLKTLLRVQCNYLNDVRVA